MTIRNLRKVKLLLLLLLEWVSDFWLFNNDRAMKMPELGKISLWNSLVIVATSRVKNNLVRTSIDPKEPEKSRAHVVVWKRARAAVSDKTLLKRLFSGLQKRSSRMSTLSGAFPQLSRLEKLKRADDATLEFFEMFRLKKTDVPCFLWCKGAKNWLKMPEQGCSRSATEISEESLPKKRDDRFQGFFCRDLETKHESRHSFSFQARNTGGNIIGFFTMVAAFGKPL